MINDNTFLPDRHSNSSVSKSTFMPVIDLFYQCFYTGIFVFLLKHFLMIIKTASRHRCTIQQNCKIEFLPQFPYDFGFFLARIKASNFFRTAISARNISFSKSSSSSRVSGLSDFLFLRL